MRISSGPYAIKLNPRCGSFNAKLLIPRSATIAPAQGVPDSSRTCAISAKSAWRRTARLPNRASRSDAIVSAALSRSSPMRCALVASRIASAWPPVPTVASTTTGGLDARTSPTTSSTITAACWRLAALQSGSVPPALELQNQICKKFRVVDKLVLGHLHHTLQHGPVPELYLIDLRGEGDLALKLCETAQLRRDKNTPLLIGLDFVRAANIEGLE